MRKISQIMKQGWPLFFIVLGLLIWWGSSRTPSLLGVWEGFDPDNGVRFEFQRNGRCELALPESFGEPSRLTGDYWVDYSKRPIPLTVRNLPQLGHPLHTIVEFRSKDEIWVGDFAPRWRLRPLSIKKDTVLRLKRKGGVIS